MTNPRDLLESEDPEVRRQAVRAIAGERKLEDLPVLFSAWKEQTRRYDAEVAKGVHEGEEQVAWYAFFHAIGSILKKDFNAIEKYLTDEDPVIRRLATDLLRPEFRSDPAPHAEKILKWYVKLLADSDAQVRLSAFLGITGATKDTLDLTLKYLMEADKDIRLFVVQAAAKSGMVGSADLLMGLLSQDRDADVRAGAAKALGTLLSKEARDKRIGEKRILRMLKGLLARVKEALEQGTKDNDESVSAACKQALEKIGE